MSRRTKKNKLLRTESPRYSRPPGSTSLFTAPPRRSLNKKPRLELKFPKRSREQIENLPFKKFIYLFLLLNIFTLLFIFVVMNKLPPQVPLYYGLARSEAQLGTPSSLVIPCLFSLVALLINLVIASFIENDFLRKTLILAGFAGILLSTITVIKIVFLIGSF